MTVTQEKLVLRWFRAGEFDRLADLCRECFPAEDWCTEDLIKFVDPVLHRKNVIKVLGVEKRDVVLGALLYTLEPGRVCRLRRLAILPARRRLGLASFALQALIGANSLTRRDVFTARVRESNYPAQSLLQKLHFTFDPAAPRQRDESGEDYYVFTFTKTARAEAS